MTRTTVRDLALAWPGVEESESYRTPALKVRGKPVARLTEDAGTIVVPMPLADQAVRIGADPEVVFVTGHDAPHPSRGGRRLQEDAGGQGGEPRGHALRDEPHEGRR